MSKRPAPSTDLFGRVTDTQPATSASSAPATADRGAGAPSLYTAREAVRQDAVRFGSSDPSSAWSERRLMLNPRSRTEHLAIGSGQQNEMFAFTPGTRAVDPRSPEAVPYSDFHATWRKKSSVDAAERDYFAQSFARANKITTKKGDDGTITASVTIERNVFEGEGSDLYDAIDALAYRVQGGPAKAVGQAPREPSARELIERARAALPEDVRARRDAYSHFMHRRILFGRARARDATLTLSEADRRHAKTINVEVPPDDKAADPVAYGLFLKRCADATRDLEDAAWFGLTRDLLPGEAMERTTAQVERVERYQNDRYIDHDVRRAPDPEARVGDAGGRGASLLERSAELEPGVDPFDEDAAPTVDRTA